jgi:hypothetical protein
LADYSEKKNFKPKNENGLQPESKNQKLKYFLDEMKQTNKENKDGIYNCEVKNNHQDRNFDSSYNIPNLKNNNRLKLNDFSDFRSELNLLQNNIDKLEKKLCNFLNFIF